MLAAFALWPGVAVASIAWYTARNGPAIRHRTGKGLARQVAEQFAVLRHSVAPRRYYVFGLYDDAKRARARHYLHPLGAQQGVFKLLNRVLGGDTVALKNKERFGRRCRERDLAAIETIAVVVKGAVQHWGVSEPRLPDVDLIMKPVFGSKGRGIERWDYRAPGSYQQHAKNGDVRSGSELLERVKRASSREAYLVQPRLVNHPQIADLGCETLSTVRVYSILDERGAPEVTHASFKMAADAWTPVDNFCAGGIATTVELATGELGMADSGRATLDWTDRSTRPDSGALILGRKLPDWDQVLDLAARAHTAFPEAVVIGWDIALSDRGPVLVEGNVTPTLDLPQRYCGAALGDTRFGELLAHHARRAEALLAERGA